MADREQRDSVTNELVAVPAARNRLPYSTPRLQAYGSVQDLTTGGGTIQTADMALPTRAMTGGGAGSSILIKDNVVRIGEHPAGFGIYLFDYKPGFQDTWGHGRQFGVIAEEVERVVPAAVSMHIDGYRQVDYGMLGIRRVLN